MVFIAAIFSGCGDKGSSIDRCQKAGYNGIVVERDYSTPVIRCSDGKIVDGKVRAVGGLYILNNNYSPNSIVYSFLPFPKYRIGTFTATSPKENNNENNINIVIDGVNKD